MRGVVSVKHRAALEITLPSEAAFKHDAVPVSVMTSPSCKRVIAHGVSISLKLAGHSVKTAPLKITNTRRGPIGRSL